MTEIPRFGIGESQEVKSKDRRNVEKKSFVSPEVQEVISLFKELRQGYDNLQEWWRQLKQALPNKKAIDLIARGNSVLHGLDFGFRRNYQDIFLRSDLSDYFNEHSDYVFVVENPALYDIRIENDSDGYNLFFVPSIRETRQRKVGEVIKYTKKYEVTPSYYPFLSFLAQTTRGMDTLCGLRVRHNALSHSQKLFMTEINLFPGKKIVWSIFQAAKDETFFPRPTERYTKSSPHQTFRFKLNNMIKEPECSFNYEINTGDLRDFFASHAIQKRLSYIPYPGFNIYSAILNACSFKPVIEANE